MSETNSVATSPCAETVVLVGLESSGKSAIFRALTGRALGDESNFRGSTVQCRHSYLSRCSLHIVVNAVTERDHLDHRSADID
jgi:hypothetical protein